MRLREPALNSWGLVLTADPDLILTQYCSHRAHFELSRRVFANVGYL